MRIFTEIGIETIGACNRRCPTCIRNSSLEEGISSWFSDEKLPMEIIQKIIFELKNLNFRGDIWLHHYNEPLLDNRLPKIASFVKEQIPYAKSGINTNGDLLTKEIIQELDGKLDRIYVSCYSTEEEATEKREELKSLFKITEIICKKVIHVTSHFSPNPDLLYKIHSNQGNKCISIQNKMLITHLGEMILCCFDIPPHFNLGNVYDNSLMELWNSKKHTGIVGTLGSPNGRQNYEYCRICPQ